jgi:hypothetical protein
MIFRRLGDLVVADYLAWSDKYHNAASDFLQLALSTHTKAAELFPLPSLQSKIRPDVSGIQQSFIRLTFCAITMRISL